MLTELEQKATELKQQVNELVEAIRQEPSNGVLELAAKNFEHSIDLMMDILRRRTGQPVDEKTPPEAK
jgi:hypothetical protein